MRLTFVINSLRLGGAQRALINVAEALADHGQSVSLVTFYRKETDFYSVSKAIYYQALGVEGDTASLAEKLAANGRRLVATRRAILGTRPGVIISFLPATNVLTLIAVAGTGIPVIVVEQADPQHAPIDRPWAVLRRWLYPFSACLVSASRGVDAYFDWLPRSRRAVIFNSLAADFATDSPAANPFAHPRRKQIVAAGRLHPQKGFDLLIPAFASLASRHPEWDLTIWGEGRERPGLEMLIGQTGLSDRVFLPGGTTNLPGVFAAADLFVLSSRYEGFGNVLIEAMACRLPVVSFDCPSGPNEIIRDGIDGLLIPPEDTGALAEAMDRLMGDERARAALAARAADVQHRFGIDVIYRQWEDLCTRLARR